MSSATLQILVLFAIAVHAARKAYEPTERIVKCIDVDMDSCSDEDKDFCKLALADVQNNMEVHRLLEKNHDPNTVIDSEGRTLLVTATFKKEKDVVAELLNFGARKGLDVNKVANSGHSALMYAAARNDADLVKMFLLAGAKVNLALTDGKKQGFTPLHFAAEHGNVKIAKLLVDAGANPEIKDAEGKTPLSRAQKQHPTTLAELEQMFSSFMGDLDLEID
jgi:ankyrin repeat protein